MRYDLQIPAAPEPISFACAVQAHSKVVRGTSRPTAAYTDCYAQALTYIASGAAETDDVPVWEAHGSPSRFSNLDCSAINPFLIAFRLGASELVDEAIKSESTMAALKKYGVNMDHPCVRAFTKEGVGANRSYLEAAAHCTALLDFLDVRLTAVFITSHLTFPRRTHRR